MRITNNIPSMQTQGALFMNNRAIAKDLEKLSTGLRVNRASDDAAGLAISEGLRAQVRGTQQAKRNALDGISALNIAEGALNEIHNIMQRQRELAIQSSTSTYSSTERLYMDDEYQALNSEIARIINSTNFNGIKLLTSTNLNAGTSAVSVTPGGTVVSTAAASAAASAQANFQVRFNGEHLWIDANSMQNVDSIRVSYTNIEGLASYSSVISGTCGANAQSSIGAMDSSIMAVSQARADIGAIINRLETTVNNLTISATNQQAAESQIRDVDFAYQSSSFTKNQIMVQSATAMLSQANATTQGVLSLIR